MCPKTETIFRALVAYQFSVMNQKFEHSSRSALIQIWTQTTDKLTESVYTIGCTHCLPRGARYDISFWRVNWIKLARFNGLLFVSASHVMTTSSEGWEQHLAMRYTLSRFRFRATIAFIAVVVEGQTRVSICKSFMSAYFLVCFDSHILC